jgi:predicted DNA-binding transcriptional regulator AlpA
METVSIAQQSPCPADPHTPANDRLLRIRDVLDKIPVSRSSWWQGVRTGRYPAPVHLGPRTTAWRESDIQALIREGGC